MAKPKTPKTPKTTTPTTPGISRHQAARLAKAAKLAAAKALLEAAEAMRLAKNERDRMRRAARKAGKPAMVAMSVAPAAAVVTMTTPGVVAVTPPTKRITLVSLLVDASGSMDASNGRISRRERAAQTYDAQIEALRKSDPAAGEFRVLPYTFADGVTSFGEHTLDTVPASGKLKHRGSVAATALVEGMAHAMTESMLRESNLTAEGYEVAHLIMAFTDGGENASSYRDRERWRETLCVKALAADNISIAVMVPAGCMTYTLAVLGLHAGMVTEWDMASETGGQEAQMRSVAAVANYTATRSTGGKKSTRVYIDLSGLTEAALAANATDISGTVKRVAVTTAKIKAPGDDAIKEYLTNSGFDFIPAQTFYELTKPEFVQAAKIEDGLAIQPRRGSAIYAGSGVRRLLNLAPGVGVPIGVEDLSKFRFYVRSDSHNRRLVPGTDILTKCPLATTAQPRA